VAESLLRLDRGPEAIQIIDECLERATGKVVKPRLVPRMMNRRLRYFEKAKDAVGCRETAERWERLNRTDAASLYDAACVRAVTAAVLRATGKPEEATAQADRAMDWLRKSVAAGYKNAAKVKTDKDLDVLRDRADFKALVAGLEAGGLKKE
jgi:hypothetical protein